MPESDVICQIAQQTLVAPDSRGSCDNWLWDRTQRIVRNVECICRLPELAEQAIALERSCLVTAAYFCSCGLRNSAADKNTADINDADVCHLSAKIASEKLTGILTETQINKANRIIIESSNRFTDMTEAMILSDGRNLEDMGAVGLLGELQHHIANGKSISDILENWKCKIEYGYWQARLKESFRYDSVRRMAARRFDVMEHFMAQLAAENTPCDFEKQLLNTSEKK
ncbi:MAG: hypothetical protein ABFR90_00420 [Planctomycetota bacterium]